MQSVNGPVPASHARVYNTSMIQLHRHRTGNADSDSSAGEDPKRHLNSAELRFITSPVPYRLQQPTGHALEGKAPLDVIQVCMLDQRYWWPSPETGNGASPSSYHSEQWYQRSDLEQQPGMVRHRQRISMPFNKVITSTTMRALILLALEKHGC